MEVKNGCFAIKSEFINMKVSSAAVMPIFACSDQSTHYKNGTYKHCIYALVLTRYIYISRSPPILTGVINCYRYKTCTNIKTIHLVFTFEKPFTIYWRRFATDNQSLFQMASSHFQITRPLWGHFAHI